MQRHGKTQRLLSAAMTSLTQTVNWLTGGAEDTSFPQHEGNVCVFSVHLSVCEMFDLSLCVETSRATSPAISCVSITVFAEN